MCQLLSSYSKNQKHTVILVVFSVYSLYHASGFLKVLKENEIAILDNDG